MKKIIQRLLAAAASAAMLSSLALPSFAAGPGTRFGTQLPAESGDNKITLTEHEGVKPTSDPHFGAYQIFTGTMHAPDPSKPDELNQHPTNPGDTNETEALEGIEFGNAFGTLDKDKADAYAATLKKIESFVIALANASNGTGDYAEYQYAFSDFKGFEDFVDGDTGKLNTEYYNEDGSTPNTSVLAKAVAEVVAAHNNREWLEEFCDIALGFGHTGDKDVFDVPGFVNQYYYFNDKTVSGVGDAQQTTWTVTLDQSGYYMVVDMSNLTEGDEDRAFSARMLLVAGTVTQDLKESVPEIEKQVQDGETWGEDATAGVGETVNFQITGTLPSNYDLFAGGYYYAFHDTLTNGLKLSQDPITIEVEGLWEDTGTGTGAADPDTWVWNAKAKQTITEGSVAPTDEHTQHITDGKAYAITTRDDGFDIVFPCLKEVYITDGDTHYMLGCGNGGKEVSKITVSYRATVTEDAIIKTGNVNTATLEYSDNPQAYNDHDTTHEDTATVYTLGLDITKVDGTKFVANGGSDGSTLAGIKFALLRGDSEKGYEIATFKQVDASAPPDDPAAGGFAGKKYYSITAWTTLNLDSEKDLAKSAQAFIAENAAAEITTDEQGKLLISGLNDEVAYTLVEVETLPGYKLAKPFQFSYKVPESAVELALEEDADCAVSGDTAMSYDKFIKDTTEDGTIEGDDGDGAGDLLMANFNVADLPATGGMGNSIYYIIGCGALVLAGVMFVLSRKKSARAAS